MGRVIKIYFIPRADRDVEYISEYTISITHKGKYSMVIGKMRKKMMNGKYLWKYLPTKNNVGKNTWKILLKLP